jgi:hypothetical protein
MIYHKDCAAQDLPTRASRLFKSISSLMVINRSEKGGCNKAVEGSLLDKNCVQINLSQSAISIGSILIFWLFFVQFISSIALWLNHSIIGWPSLALAFALSIFAATFLNRPRPAQKQAIVIGGALILLCGVIGLSSLIHDFSFDGQDYHQQAVIELTHGWNPYFDSPVEGSQALWVNSYPKGAWFIAAAITIATANIETGKAINLIYGLSAFLLVLPAVMVLVRKNRLWAGCLAGVAALNPVLGYQWLSYYLDSQIGSIFLIIIAVIVLADRKAILLQPAVAIVMASLAMLINVKFTGLVFACVTISLIAILAVIYGGRAYVLRILLGGGIAVALGVFIVGWNPYVSNIIRHGTLFYPLVGSDRVDIITSHGDREFLERDRISKLLLSTFARSHSLMAKDLQGKNEIELKIPFTISTTELKYFATRQDTRIGGFGPLFGGGALLAVLIFINLLFFKQSRREIMMFGAVSLALIATVLVVPEPWWARYVPQFWLLPPILILSGFFYGKNRLMLGVSKFATGVLLLNCSLVWGAAIGGAALSEISLRNQLTHLSLLSAQGHAIFVKFSAESSKLRLVSEGINFQEVNKLECSHPMPLIRSFATLCVDHLELRDTDYNVSFLMAR